MHLLKDKSRRQSSGSRSRGSFNTSIEIKNMLNGFIAGKDKEVFFGSTKKVSELQKFEVADLPKITESDIKSHFGKTIQKTIRKKRKKVLGGKNEDELQNCLSGDYGALKAVDTHVGCDYAIEFLKPRDVDGGGTAYLNTGKADLTSETRRMVFEVKSKGKDAELILQMLERLVTSLDISHITQNSTVFGATPTNGYMFFGERSIPTFREDSHVVSLHFYSVPIADILYLWSRASTVSGPQSFLTVDAALVMHGIKAAGYNPWLCRVRLLDWSQHNVYAISVPQKFKSHDGVHCDKPDFALKVMRSNDAFDREETALTAIKPDYILGTRRHNNNEPISIGENECKKRWKLKKSTKNIWWASAVRHLPGEGGVVVMKLGEKLGDDIDANADLKIRIIDDCMNSLQRIHNAGYVHTDLRRPNLLLFNDKFMPVDFGEAVQIGTAVNLDDFSSGRRNLTFNRNTAGNVEWGKEHDVDMLFRAVCNFPPPRKNVETNELQEDEAKCGKRPPAANDNIKNKRRRKT